MNQAQQTKAFNLILEGVGYLNRIREVPVRKGPGYVACTINAMMGEADSVEYISLDLRVVGSKALSAIELLRKDVAERRKVIVGFRAGDPRVDVYEYTDGEGVPRKVEGLKARLLQLTFAKVDGQRIEIPVVERPSGDESAESGAGTVGADAPSEALPA